LEAEKRGDHAASFGLLSTSGRMQYPSPSDWARRRSELPAVTGYSIEREGETVIALVEHKPGLDPFVGLSPGRERQTWKGVKEGSGWLVDPDPATQPVLPPDDKAPAAALAWSKALQACDGEKAKSQQAVAALYGISDAPSQLCNAKGEISVGSAEALPAGPASQDLVTQYGPESLSWARAVRVAPPAPSHAFHVVLAPVGDGWQVVGVFEP
jgi:hypothetical protein